MVPAISPHLWSYRQLLTRGAGRDQFWEGEQAPPSVCDWLQDLAAPACQLFAASRRLAREHVGWEFLETIEAMD